MVGEGTRVEAPQKTRLWGNGRSLLEAFPPEQRQGAGEAGRQHGQGLDLPPQGN